MPGYIIHLAAARELQPFLEDRNIIKNDYDRNAFHVSCLIPDAVSDKRKTHYRQTEDPEIQLCYPQPWRFCARYPHLIHTPEGIGYLFHLYVDYLFYQEYFCQHVMLTDANYIPQIKKDKIELALILDFQKILPGQDFFKKKYLYDDYTSINAVLEGKYQLNYDFAPVSNPGIAEVDYEKIGKIQQEILYYSKLSRESDFQNTRILKVEPLLQFIQSTAPRFLMDYSFVTDETASIPFPTWNPES